MNILKNIGPTRGANTFTLINNSIKRARMSMSSDIASERRFVAEPLSERVLVRVQGEEVVPFLQGLITNDMNHLMVHQSMYAMFLNKAGRIQYDSIIYRKEKDPDTYFIECDKQVNDELCRHLRLYRVRRKIDISNVEREFKPWIVFNPDPATDVTRVDTANIDSDEFIVTPDPRLRELGLRIIAKSDATWRDVVCALTSKNDMEVVESSDKCNYRLLRYRCGVGEGVYDIPPGKAFPLEANGDFLHGVSFQKGCYIGQELTARVYHTGVIRKRLMPLKLSAPVVPNVTTVQTETGANVGTIRSSHANCALALMRVEPALKAKKLMLGDHVCYLEKPKWWPTELPKKASVGEGY